MYQPKTSSAESSSQEWNALDDLLYDLDALSIPILRRDITAIQPDLVRIVPSHNSKRKKCRVPGCTLKPCKLGTHQSFNLNLVDRPQESPRRVLGRQAAAFLRQVELYGKELPSSGGIDGFPTLPIEETLDLSARSLFHFFFTTTFDKLARLFRGPSVNNLADFKQRMLATALASESYCRSLILQAQIEQDVSRGEVEESQSALTLHTKTLTSFRAQIALINEKPHPLHIELALLVVCILLAYDYAHDKMEALQLHWQGMRNLVAIRGGIHCVTMAVAYVLQVDRLCGVFVDEMPTFINPSPASVPMPLLKFTSPRYGAYFRTELADIDTTVLEYLADVSELVEMWESSMKAKNVKDRRGAEASPEYLHYSRDRLDEQFTIFHAGWVQVDGPERCLLWASRIVEYPCTWSNHVVSMTMKLCDKLVDALQQHGDDVLRVWRTKLDVLRWILFALLMNVSGADLRSWATTLLRKTLDEKYNSLTWPHDWCTEEQTNLQKFVWSDLRYSSKFQTICALVEQSRTESTVPSDSDSRETQSL